VAVFFFFNRVPFTVVLFLVPVAPYVRGFLSLLIYGAPPVRTFFLISGAPFSSRG